MGKVIIPVIFISFFLEVNIFEPEKAIKFLYQVKHIDI